MKRKNVYRLTALLLSLLMILPLAVSCGKKPQTPDDPPEEENPDPVPAEEEWFTVWGDFKKEGRNLSLSYTSYDNVFSFSGRIDTIGGVMWTLQKDGEEVPFTSQVPLKEGKNEFILLAESQKESREYTVTVDYEKAYTVLFGSVGNSSETPKQTVKDGEKAVRPTDPTREGYTFLGWYSEGEVYDFSKSVTDDLVLVAHWDKNVKTFEPSDSTVPQSTGFGASLRIVWKDYADARGLRPGSVTCVLTVGKETKNILVYSDRVEWENGAFDGVTIGRGAGNWTLTVTGLPDGDCTLAQKPLSGNYSTAVSGASFVNTVVGYSVSVDNTAWLTARDGHFFDDAGNVIVLNGVVTVNIGNAKLETSTSSAALSHLKELGCNAVRLTTQLVGNNGAGYVYQSNGGSRTSDYNDGNAKRVTSDVKASILSTIDKVVNRCASHGMYIVLDWGILTSEPHFFTNDACDFFGKLAKKYADNPYVIYEICNEPSAPKGTSGTIWESSIRPYAYSVIETIRQESPRSVIILAPDRSATALSAYSSTATAGDDPIDKPLDDDHSFNVAYTFHCYPANYKYETYAPKLRDAVNAGLTVVSTEFSPMDATFDNPDKTAYDFEEMAKYLRLFQEWDINFFYFRYNSEGAYNENLMLLPNVDLAEAKWGRDDLTKDGQWYYDLITGGMVTWVMPDYSTVQKRTVISKYDNLFSRYGLGNVFPGFAVPTLTSQEGGGWFFGCFADDDLTNAQYHQYLVQLWAAMKAIADGGTVHDGNDGPISANALPNDKYQSFDFTYSYQGIPVRIHVSYSMNNALTAFGILIYGN